jgi:hypothetical protein
MIKLKLPPIPDDRPGNHAVDHKHAVETQIREIIARVRADLRRTRNEILRHESSLLSREPFKSSS